MPANLPPPSAPGTKSSQGMRIWRFQLVLLAMGLAFVGTFSLVEGHMAAGDIAGPLVFTFIVGNCTYLLAVAAAPAYWGRSFPWDLLVLLLIVIPASTVSGYFASVVTRLILHHGVELSLSSYLPDILKTAFFSLVITVPIYLSGRSRARLEMRTQELESQVTLGQTERKTQEAELRAASEIQTHLLPREIPRVKGLEVACAWQPARSVSGDYFDVLALAPGRIGVCLADVSGKGMSAALLMANLQALVRTFAPGTTDPGALCRKVNEALCDSVLPGKFVALFYGLIDSQTLTMRFENAGHCPPIVLRGDSTTLLTEGGTVLGLFPQAQYEERSFPLQPGDCLLLTTDGVTEAADGTDEEFGAERVAASALAARSLGANGIRTRILEDASRFCNGNFHDDASLIVVTVD
ncbi:MAG: PP2C family protein-serine/threonine phosphatase [Terriglobia bacterium]